MEHSFVDDSAAAIDPEAIAQAEDDDDEAEAEAAEDGPWSLLQRSPPGGHGRRKIEIEYIEDKIRRHITFSKRKAGISKKAYELSRLTGAQVLLLISSERGQIYSFATPKLQPVRRAPRGDTLPRAPLTRDRGAAHTTSVPNLHSLPGPTLPLASSDPRERGVKTLIGSASTRPTRRPSPSNASPTPSPTAMKAATRPLPTPMVRRWGSPTPRSRQWRRRS